jgi:hypothetical protein
MENKHPTVADAGLVKVVLAYPNERSSQMAVYTAILTQDQLKAVKDILTKDGM